LNHISFATTGTPATDVARIGLAEDDDVAFSLRLCREIDRIYDAYQEGGLDDGHNTWAGLRITLEMLNVLQNTVTHGVTGMRLQVAIAQVREINQGLFAGRADVETAPDLDRPPRILPSSLDYDWLTTELAVLDDTGPDVGGGAETSRRERANLSSVALSHLARFWGGKSLLLKLVLGMAGCVLLAILIDVPFTLMALFPSMLIPIAAAFIGVPLVVGGVRRLR
jgi:hypothetical protein